jgi:hypothetical protein
MRAALACFGLVLAACGADEEASKAEAEQAIRACFAGYKAAVLDGEGKAAARHVTASTIAYYETLLEFILHASAEDTMKLPLIDRMTVLLMRARIEADLLRTMDGRKLFVHAVDIGMIGKDSVIRNELGEVVVSGDHATGEHVSAGAPSGIHMRFHHEDGAWRMDLVSIFPSATLAFQKAIQASGMTEDEFILKTIAIVTGRKPTDDVWQPVAR